MGKFSRHLSLTLLGLGCTSISWASRGTRCETSLQSWGFMKQFWGWQTLASLFIVSFFGVHEFAQRLAVWSPPHQFIFVSEALLRYYTILQPLLIRISYFSFSKDSQLLTFQVASNFAHLSIWPQHCKTIKGNISLTFSTHLLQT